MSARHAVTRRHAKNPETMETVESLNRAAADVTFLSEAGKILASSIELDETFRHLSEILVPAIADICVISLIRPDGKAERVWIKHVNPDKERILQELNEKYPLTPKQSFAMMRAIRERRPELIHRITERNLRAHPGLPELVQKAGLRSFLATPMNLEEGRIIGAFWLGTTDDSGRELSEDELKLAEDLSLLSAQAVNNASLFHKALSEAERLRVMQKVREEFTRKQIHDIKTPLTAASLVLQLAMRRENIPSELAHHVQSALDNIARAVGMVNNARAVGDHAEPERAA